MYYPKSKIITNLYTNGQELVYLLTEQPYEGSYHILSDGKIYTGRNQDDGQPQGLKFVTLNLPDLGGSDTPAIPVSNTIYDYIRGKQQISAPKIELVEPKYTQPAVKYPILTRYFLRRTNNAIFTEVSLEDYTAIKNRDNKYNWGIYIPFELPWATSGAYIKETNERMVLLTENRYKVYGFTQYITNYTEFSI
jgi:hypothetical protein